MVTSRRVSVGWILASLLGAAAGSAQTPPETFGEEVVVRETSVVALPPGGGRELPASGEVVVAVDGLAQRVTRVEKVLDGKRGDWRFVVYMDPLLAGARTRFLTALALGQRAETLAAMGSVEVLVADQNKPALERTDSWQRIEAALLSHALEAKHRLARGDRQTERPRWELFEDRLEQLLDSLEGRTEGGPRALFLPADGLFTLVGAEELEPLARRLAGAGWVMVPMPWSERPSESSAARLSEFESWKQSAEGRDTSAGTRRYVIDFGRVFRQLSGAGERPRAAQTEVEPEVVPLRNLAAPSSGLLAARDAELNAALSNLARRWRIWFQTGEASDAEPRSLEVRLGGEALEAPAWFVPPPVD